MMPRPAPHRAWPEPHPGSAPPASRGPVVWQVLPAARGRPVDGGMQYVAWTAHRAPWMRRRAQPTGLPRQRKVPRLPAAGNHSQVCGSCDGTSRVSRRREPGRNPTTRVARPSHQQLNCPAEPAQEPPHTPSMAFRARPAETKRRPQKSPAGMSGGAPESQHPNQQSASAAGRGRGGFLVRSCLVCLVMGLVVGLGLRSRCSISCRCRCRSALLGRCCGLRGGVLRQHGTGKSYASNKQRSDRKFTHHDIEPRVVEGIANPAGTRQLE